MRNPDGHSSTSICFKIGIDARVDRESFRAGPARDVSAETRCDLRRARGLRGARRARSVAAVRAAAAQEHPPKKTRSSSSKTARGTRES